MENELTGTFILKNQEKYQFVYGSQNYGVYYAIYANIEIDSNGFIRQIDLKLLNYKGPINLGFNSHEVNHKYLSVNQKGSLNFPIFIKGLSTLRDCHIDIPENLYHKDQINSIFIFKILLPLNSGTPYRNEVFDSEFYTRSGINSPEPKPNYIKNINTYIDSQIAIFESISEKSASEKKSLGTDCRYSFLDVIK